MTYDDFRAGELEGWDARANTYETATARATVQSIPDLLAAARVASGKRLLDVCCGPGFAAGAAAALGVEAHGVDFAPGMVRVAQARFPCVTFVEGDAENLPFDNASFDAVVCNFGVNHVTDPVRAAREAFRVLTPDGYYAYSAWLPPEQNPAFKLIFGSVGTYADMSAAPPAPDQFALACTEGARFLTDIGFMEISHRTVQGILCAPASGLFDYLMRWSVRMPLIVQNQSEAVREKIRTAIETEARAFIVGDEIRIPLLSTVVSSRKGEVAS